MAYYVLGRLPQWAALIVVVISGSAFDLYINIMRNWCPFVDEGCVLLYLSLPIFIQNHLIGNMRARSAQRVIILFYIIAIESQNWQSCQTWQRLWDSPMQASHIYHYHVIYQNASFGMYCSNCNVLIMLYNFPTGFLMNKSINIRFHIWYASFGG